MYNITSLLKVLGEWNAIAERAGVSRPALAYRWIAYHSVLRKEHGDAVIIGGKNPRQVSEDLEAIEQGPLKDDTVAQIENLWELVKDEAPVDNYSY